MRPRPLRRLIFILLGYLFAFTRPVSAQAPLDPRQMPSRTIFYLIWRGAPSPEARQSNALLGLWDDPDFAPVRSAVVEAMLSDPKKDKASPPVSAEQLSSYSALLDNSFVAGYLSEPEGRHKTSPGVPPPGTRPWNGFFFVYNRAGKEDVLSKAVVGFRAREKTIPKLTPVTIAGISALRIERGAEITYWAEEGRFAISASERSVFEDIANRLFGKPAETASLADDSAYQEAKPLLGSGVVEFFLRVPNLAKLAKNSAPADMRAQPIMNALKLDTLHSLAGHISLEGRRMRMQGALLGDTSKGTLFDIFADGQSAPSLLADVPPDAVYFNEVQLNLSGIYDTVKRVARAALNPQQQGTVDLVEALAQSRLGMPLSDALALFTGEFVRLQTDPVMDFSKQSMLLGIRDKPQILKLLRTLMSDRIASERNDGDTTYLKISLQGGEGTAGVAQWRFYYLGVTPDKIMGAANSQELHAALARLGTASAGASPAAGNKWQAGLSQFPARLNGVTYLDFGKLDWQAVKTTWVKSLETPAEKTSASAKAQPRNVVPEWLSRTDPAVFPRHLHSSISATWKDAAGFHFDQWLE